ncbi:ATP-dependent DNA helicase [Trichonephila clavata]|uniref:ATP-dependent DNA helicase n=1 Tax=Trichonephila clavata TaxID=2740835 RepID=A0A8X6I034_TRICU|nr:ATP-dependent DNA helicase [Trichonephila clavata]
MHEGWKMYKKISSGFLKKKTKLARMDIHFIAAEDGGFSTFMNVRHSEVVIDNRWIVPYFPLLSRIFCAHINVEYCNSIKSIKYVCKYINKGCDMAVFDVTSSDRNAHNEIYRYEMGRYISSNEAVWRILNFPIHERYPTVIHLSVHLEKRTENLLHRSNYKEARQVRGLLENDEHWNATLEEAAFVHSPRMLRDLFAVMLQVCALSNPNQLWINHQESLSEDILHQVRIQQRNMDLEFSTEIFNEALIIIEDKVRSLGGSDLKSIGLPQPDRDSSTITDVLLVLLLLC